MSLGLGCYDSKSWPSKTALSNETEDRERRVNEVADNLEFCFVLQDDSKLAEGVYASTPT